MSESEARLRPRPADRFSGETHLFNLPDALRQLRAEAHPAGRKHRQITLFQRAPVTQALFAFEPGGELADHSAHGLVTIQALEGHLTVQAAGAVHELEPGMMLVLNPDVRHNVRADATGGAMLLTVTAA